MNPDQAFEYEVPFGKWKGKTLGELYDDEEEGRAYISWLATKAKITSKSFASAVKSVYDRCGVQIAAAAEADRKRKFGP